MITLLRSYHGQTAGYDSRQGSFESWLWGVVRNRVKAERRRRTKEVLVAPVQESRDDEHVEPLAPTLTQPPADFSLAEAEQERQAVWVAALQRVRQRVKPETFAIYAALLEQSSAPDALARKYGKTVNNIYAMKHRCDELLLAEAQSIRKEQQCFTNRDH
jgi:DNA-directed RNA polymerase specialized sigma24 family protein